MTTQQQSITVLNNIVSLQKNTSYLLNNSIETTNEINKLTTNINTINDNISSTSGHITTGNITTGNIKTDNIKTNDIIIKDGNKYTEIKEYINDAIEAGGDPTQPINTYNNITISDEQTGDIKIQLTKEGDINSNTLTTNTATINGQLTITDNTNTISIDPTNSSITSNNITIQSGILTNEIQSTDSGKVIVNKEYVDKQLIDKTQTLKLTTAQDSIYAQGNIKVGYIEGQTENPAILLNSNGTINSANITTDSLNTQSININNNIIMDNTGQITGNTIQTENTLINNEIQIGNQQQNTLITDNSITVDEINTEIIDVNGNCTINSQGDITTNGTIQLNNTTITSSSINSNALNINTDKATINSTGDITCNSITINTDKAVIDNQGNITTQNNITLYKTLTIGETNGITITNTPQNIISNVNNIFVSSVDETNNNSVINLDYLTTHITKNSGNYFALTISNIPNPSGYNENDIILYENNNTYTLRKYHNTSFEDYNVPNSSLCVVSDAQRIFTKFEDINNKQNWLELIHYSSSDRYNFFSFDIYSTTEGHNEDYVFVVNNNVYTLYKKENNTYIAFNAGEGSLCAIENNNRIFIKYTGLNNWIELSSSIDEYHYNVDEIRTTLLNYTTDFILYENNNLYSLYKWNETTNEYNLYETAPIGALCTVNTTSELFIRFKDIAHPENKQNWIKIDIPLINQNNYYVDEILTE